MPEQQQRLRNLAWVHHIRDATDFAEYDLVVETNRTSIDSEQHIGTVEDYGYSVERVCSRGNGLQNLHVKA